MFLVISMESSFMFGDFRDFSGSNFCFAGAGCVLMSFKVYRSFWYVYFEWKVQIDNILGVAVKL